MSVISINRRIVWLEGIFGESRPAFLRVRLRYTKRTDADRLVCKAMVRGVELTTEREIDVSGIDVGSTSTVTTVLMLYNAPPLYDVYFTMAQDLTDVPTEVSLDPTKALVVFVTGYRGGRLDIVDAATGYVIDSIEAEDVNNDNRAGAYAVVMASRAITVRLDPTDVRYSFYVVPRNYIDNARINVVVVCREEKQSDSRTVVLGRVWSSVLAVAARMVPYPELKLELVSWDASG